MYDYEIIVDSYEFLIACVSIVGHIVTWNGWREAESEAYLSFPFYLLSIDHIEYMPVEKWQHRESYLNMTPEITSISTAINYTHGQWGLVTDNE